VTGIWSTETGSGPLLVVVHGSMDRSAGMLRLSRRLDDRFRVARYDRRGYGRSSPHEGPFGIDEQVSDLVTLLDGRRAVLFGHSYGGNVVLAVADRHPELVSSAVVYETPLSWLEWWPGSTAGAAALATQGDPADAAERFMRRLIGDERWQRLPPSTRSARRAEGAAMVGELTDLRQRAPWSADRIGVPVLALHGEHGAAHHRDAMEHLADCLPSCRVETIADARHPGPNTHAEAVAAAVMRFVDHS
jgi:pimeloyl-ACP methyl ester carboxylesterase